MECARSIMLLFYWSAKVPLFDYNTVVRYSVSRRTCKELGEFSAFTELIQIFGNSCWNIEQTVLSEICVEKSDKSLRLTWLLLSNSSSRS